MGRAGILAEDERVELRGGEIIVMAAIGNRHRLCATGDQYLYRRTPRRAGILRQACGGWSLALLQIRRDVLTFCACRDSD